MGFLEVVNGDGWWAEMWFVIWNLLVLPSGVLPIAVPFSFIETLGAGFLCRKRAKPPSAPALT